MHGFKITQHLKITQQLLAVTGLCERWRLSLQLWSYQLRGRDPHLGAVGLDRRLGPGKGGVPKVRKKWVFCFKDLKKKDGL